MRLFQGRSRAAVDRVRDWPGPPPGTVAIATARVRARVRVAGRVRSMRIRPWGDVPSLEATITDGTGSIDVVFLGRRRVPGLRLGGWLLVEGTVGAHHGRAAVLNPSYDFLPTQPGLA